MHQFLSNFGNIRNFNFGTNFAEVQYHTNYNLKAVLHTRQNFHGCPLTIKINTRKQLKRKQDDRDQSVPLTERTIPQQLSDNKTLPDRLKEYTVPDEQLDYLLDVLQVPPIEIQDKYALLCQHLEHILSTSEVFFGCKAMQFGSTVTGLAFKGSDLDVFILITQKNGKHGSPGKTPLSVHYVKQARKPLYSRPDLFTKVIGITGAKTPILKCLHKPTGISCDINFKNMLGVANSQLVNFLLHKDNRLRPMMMILKYWAKINDITGPGKLNNYTLVMMTIFFWQQLEKPILPPISMLQESEYDRWIIDGWNAGYNHNFYFVNNNFATIPELLKEFFEFYSTYEFALKVISPFLGTTLSRSDFTNVPQLNQLYWRYKDSIHNNRQGLNIDTCMCIQDAIEHNHNLTKSISLSMLQHFQNCCTLGMKICDDVIKNDQAIQLLPRLLSENKPISAVPIVTNHESELVILATSIFSLKKTKETNETLQREMWYKRIIELIVLMLEKILKLNITLEELTNSPKNIKSQELTNLATDVQTEELSNSTTVVKTQELANSPTDGKAEELTNPTTDVKPNELSSPPTKCETNKALNCNIACSGNYKKKIFKYDYEIFA